MARSTVMLATALAIALVLPLALSTFYVVLLIEIAVAALFATAFNLLMGFGGMVSFGHAAYFALGAYAAALLAQKAGWPMLAAFAAAPLVAAFGALVFGFFIVRLTHTYFAMLSLAFAQILYTIIFKWTSLTGGDNGLLNVWPPAFLRSATAYYYFTLLVIGACFVALHAIVNSPFGYALKAIRENPRRARFIGVNVRRHQLYAFVLSGFFSGVAGAVFTFHNGSVFPDFAFFTKSFEPLIVALLGGMQSFYGPLAGAFGFKLMEWLISRWAPIYWPLFLGAILIVVIVAQVPEDRRVFGKLTVRENLEVARKTWTDRGATPWTAERVFELFPRLLERRNHRSAQSIFEGTLDRKTFARSEPYRS